jgi:predicted CXXCH cytochrome family protein
VNDPSHLPSPRLTFSGRAAFLVVALLLAGIVWALGPSVRTIGGFRSSSAGGSLRSRDVYADSPYRNARPGVGYVGDAACTRCHREIVEAYHSHPMGRSMTPVRGPAEGPPTGAATGLPFEAQGLRYTIERRDGRVFHKATRRGADGGVLAETEAEVRHALGSGTRGINFLIERDGFLFQSPIAWFAQQGRWDISPGYAEQTPHPDFERAIQADCLFCHANGVRPLAGPLNRYESPIFQGHAIGCERCHGPGELHVKGGGSSAESDLTIVNPAELAPALRDSVCQQCHLQGAFRTTRAGRKPFDFRPGLPLHRFWAVFQMTKGSRDQFEAVGHVEQIESSRCFRESQGQLGCISCHDPHRLPAPATRVAYYRDRCMECHQRRGCALPSAERQARGQGEDCVACHMPRLAVTNIPHTAATDHRIPRGVPGSVPQRPRVAPGQPGEIPLLDYHWGLMTTEERQGAQRDLGVASAWVARRLDASPQLAKIAATQALPLLEAAVRDRPDDLTAGNSLGVALEILGRGEEALRVFEAALRIDPGHELTLRSSGRLAARLQRLDLASATLQKTIAVNPWRSDYRLALAKVCSQAGDWPGAIAACREAIRLNPDLVEARSLLVECYLRSDERAKADAEFQTLLRFYPASREVWQQWYEQQKQPGRTGIEIPTSVKP